MATKGKQPFIQFFTGDWFGDGGVRMCSAATRGVWVDALLTMHREGARGHLTGTLEQLAKACMCTEMEVNRALDELNDTGTACVIDHAKWLNGHAHESVDNCVHISLNELCDALPRQIVPHDVPLMSGRFTLINRRMAREHIERENSRLRKQRQRKS